MRDPVQRRCYALAASGLDPDQAMERVPTYSNEVWLGADHVLRLNHRELAGGSPARLLREAQIAARLSSDVRYPAIVSVGSDDDRGMAWLIARRVPGIQLGRAWATMSPNERERAIHQLADALDVLHATPTDGIVDDIEPPHTLPLAALLGLIERAVEAREDPVLLGELAAFSRERWHVFDDAPTVLVHGDPHLENVLWDGTDVTALLDLEWSRASWRECDLEILLAIADHPALFAAEDYERSVHPPDYTDIPRWLSAARPAWFAHPDLADRLELLHISRTLGALVDAPRTSVRLAHLSAVLAGASPFRSQLSGLLR